MYMIHAAETDTREMAAPRERRLPAGRPHVMGWPDYSAGSEQHWLPGLRLPGNMWAMSVAALFLCASVLPAPSAEQRQRQRRVRQAAQAHGEIKTVAFRQSTLATLSCGMMGNAA